MKTTILLITVFFLVLTSFNIAPAQEKKSVTKTRLKPADKIRILNILPNSPKANKSTVANGNWSSGATWNGGTVPADGDNITINNNVTLDMPASPVTTGSLTISSGFTLTMSSETILYIGSTASITGTLLENAGSSISNTCVFPMGHFTINSGGTFNSSASNTSLYFSGTANQNFTINGTITSPLNDLSIDNPSRNITLTAGSGSISTNNLTLYNGNLTNTAKNITLTAGALLTRYDGSISAVPLGTSYDLEYDNSLPANTGPELQNNTVIRDFTINSNDNVTMTANVNVNRNFYIYGGNLNIGAFTLTLNGNIQVTSGFFFPGTLTGGATSRLILNGTGSDTLPAIVSGLLKYLTINRAASDIITLSGSLQIADTLNMANGNIDTGPNLLTLGTSTGSTGTLSYTWNPMDETGIISGNFRRWFGTTSTGLTKFPVGDVSLGFGTGLYPKKQMELTFTSIGTGGSLTVSFIKGDPQNYNITAPSDAGYAYAIDSYSYIGMWKIIPTGLASYTYSINIYPSGAIGANNPPTLRVIKRAAGSTDPWALQGNHSAGSGSMPNLKASRTTLNSFGEFALGGASLDNNPLDRPLPVELSSFSSSVNVNNVNLTWTTASEINNRGFEIYRKSAQTDWNKIGFVNGSGTTNTPNTYYYMDKNLSTGKYSYKLKQMDYNGNYEYFMMPGIAEIGAPNRFVVSQNYPNPFNPVTKIDYQLPDNGKIKLVIYDMLGREVKNLVNEVRPAGFYSAEFDATSLASGVYVYKLSFGNGNSNFLITKRMSLIK